MDQEYKDLTDQQWNAIRPLIPPPSGIGRPRVDDRTTVNGVLYVLGANCRWRDMPDRYGSHITCWRRYNAWSKDGTLSDILACVNEDRYEEDAPGSLDEMFALAGTESQVFDGAGEQAGAPLRTRILLAFQRLLLGEIEPELTGVGCRWSATYMEGRFYYTAPASDAQRAHVAVLESRLVREFPSMRVSLKTPDAPLDEDNQSMTLVFQRKAG